MLKYVLALVAFVMLGGTARAEFFCTPPPWPAIHYEVTTLSSAESEAASRAYYAWEAAWRPFLQCESGQRQQWADLGMRFEVAYREWMRRWADWRQPRPDQYVGSASGITGCVDPVGSPPQIPDGAADDQGVERVAQDVENWLIRMDHATQCKYRRKLSPERAQAISRLLAAYDTFLDAYHRGHPLHGTTITAAAHIADLPRRVYANQAAPPPPPPALDSNTCPMEHFEPDLSRRGRSGHQLNDDAGHYWRAREAFYACYNRLLARRTSDRDWQAHVKAYYQSYIKELDAAVPSWGYSDSATSDDVAAPPHANGDEQGAQGAEESSPPDAAPGDEGNQDAGTNDQGEQNDQGGAADVNGADQNTGAGDDTQDGDQSTPDAAQSDDRNGDDQNSDDQTGEQSGGQNDDQSGGQNDQSDDSQNQ